MRNIREEIKSNANMPRPMATMNIYSFFSVTAYVRELLNTKMRFEKYAIWDDVINANVLVYRRYR